MTTWILVICGAILGLTASAFFSGSETGLYSVSRVRLHLAARKGDRRARSLERLLADQQGSLASILIGNNVANYVITTAFATLFTDLIALGKTETELYTVALVTPLLFVFGEVVPKNIFHLYADGLMIRVGWALAVVSSLCRLSGAVWFFRGITSFVGEIVAKGHAAASASASPKQRIAALLSDALVSDTAGAEQSDLVQRVVALTESAVHTVMVPQNRVVAISARADRRELIRLVRRTGRSTLPVFDTSRRHIMGQVSVDRLLKDPDWRVVGERLATAVTVRPHATLAETMTALQKAHRELAVVTDRGGRLLGIVTMTDLLEWLVRDPTEST